MIASVGTLNVLVFRLMLYRYAVAADGTDRPNS